MSEKLSEKEFLYPGEKRGKELFYELEELSEQNKYDDDYLLKLIEYQKLCPENPNFDIFYAKYALFHGNREVAIEYATKAEKTWHNNLEIWKILEDCYEKSGETLEHMIYTGLLAKHIKLEKNLCFSSDASKRDTELLLFSRAQGRGDYFPGCEVLFRINENGLEKKAEVYRAGDFFPFFYEKKEPYFVGAYVDDDCYNGKGELLWLIKDREKISHLNTEFVFDAIRSKKGNDFTVGATGKKYIVPLAGNIPDHLIQISIGEKKGQMNIGKWEYSFLRLEEKARLSAEEPFIMGNPILLEHSPKRKKAVINILADALPWAAIKRNNYEWIPNIMKFFSKGVVFDNQFSASEYTYPSLVTLETGMYPGTNKMQVEIYPTELTPEIETVSEKMNGLGYYCTHLLGTGVYNGATRGYDRQILNSYTTHTFVAIERIIRQLEAFDECDNFMFVHADDTHPMKKNKYHFLPKTQTHLSAEDVMSEKYQSVNGIDLPCSPAYTVTNIHAIQSFDRTIKTLFDYLEEHYSDDEYIVQLYSDHGNFVHSDDRYMLKEDQTNAAYLVRGAGVPSVGHVDELTSTADIYAVLGHLAGYEISENVDGNLPEVFGGKRRDHVISSSVMPGQTYKLCIRTETHEFRLESRECTDLDCTADLTNARCELYDRRTKEQVAPTDEQKAYFIGLVQKYTKERDNHGHVFSSVKWKFEEEDEEKR